MLRDTLHRWPRRSGLRLERRLRRQSPDENQLTIEQLAAESGMTVRNIRSHRARGLLPAPVVRDRVGYYGAAARRPPADDPGAPVRGLQPEGHRAPARAEPGPRRAVPLLQAGPRCFIRDRGAAGVHARRVGRAVRPIIRSALKQAIEVGVLVPIGEDRFEARFPSLLDAAEGVLAQGVPLGHALVVLSKVEDRCRSVAREFVRLFLEDVWKPFEEAGYPEERWPEVGDVPGPASPTLHAGPAGDLPNDHVRRSRRGVRQAARAPLEEQEVIGRGPRQHSSTGAAEGSVESHGGG